MKVTRFWWIWSFGGLEPEAGIEGRGLGSEELGSRLRGGEKEEAEAGGQKRNLLHRLVAASAHFKDGETEPEGILGQRR